MEVPAGPAVVDRPELRRHPALHSGVARERLRGQIEDGKPVLRLDRGPTGERFVTYVDAYGDFRRVDWLDPSSGDTAVWDVLLHLFRDEGVDPKLAVLFTTFELPSGIYYLPLANDVSGIGEPLYDRTKNRLLDGYVFMNDVPYWVGTPERVDEAATLFNQEVGHRFGVFVETDLGKGPSSELLGRDQQHWSYFVHTGASPMEGNAWIDNGDGTFTTDTPPNNLFYHPLDLYLMGLVPADDVEGTFVIRNPGGGGLDCFGFPLGPGSVPQFCEPQKTVMGERHDFGVADIVAVEGPREPAWPDAPDRFEIAFVLLALPGDERSADLLFAFDDLVGRLVDGFHAGTGGRAELVLVTGQKGGLDDLGETEGCGCRLASPPPGGAFGVLMALLLAGYRRRRR